MDLDGTSLPELSGRATELVTGRSKLRILLGKFGFFFSESPVQLLTQETSRFSYLLL